MTRIANVLVTATALTLAACGQPADTPKEPAAGLASEGSPTTDADATAVHQATGTVKSVSGTTVTLAHGPVESLNWPAMTMSFEAPDATMVRDIKPGDRVAFSFRQSEGGYFLTEVRPAQP